MKKLRNVIILKY